MVYIIFFFYALLSLEVCILFLEVLNSSYYRELILNAASLSLSQEMDSIVTQMIQVADYLGWDVTELRPVSGEPLLSQLCKYIKYSMCSHE